MLDLIVSPARQDERIRAVILSRVARGPESTMRSVAIN
jgi:hypothetical protein